MWTHGFHNSVNGDRVYNANQMSSIFEGLITAGIYQGVGNKLAVQPNSGMTIQIATGRGWFNERWVNNDSPYLITLEASDVLLNRYAAICVRGDNSTAVRSTQPYVKYSEFATTPVKPTMTRTADIKEYCLAYVYIAAGATAISAADIEDTRQDSNLCGWVTGLVDQITPNTLYSQFTAQFNEWFSGLVDIIDENVETTLVNALPKALTVNMPATGWSKYGVVDLGTLNWTYYTSGTNKIFYSDDVSGIKIPTNNGEVINLFCTKYVSLGVCNVRSTLTTVLSNKQMSQLTNNGKVVIRDDSYVSEETFKSSLSGVMLIYELSDPDSYTGNTVYVQSATVTGMNATKSVLVTPNGETLDAYGSNGLKATAQGTNSITFTANTKPTAAIKVDVLHMGQ